MTSFLSGRYHRPLLFSDSRHRRFSPSPALSTLVPNSPSRPVLCLLAPHLMREYPNVPPRPLRAQCGCSLYVVRYPECHSGIKNNSDISAAACLFNACFNYWAIFRVILPIIEYGSTSVQCPMPKTLTPFAGITALYTCCLPCC